jgi:hypothetical protein
LLAADLRSQPRIEFKTERFYLYGSAAVWTLRTDGQVILDLEPSETDDVTPGLPTSSATDPSTTDDAAGHRASEAAPQSDLVAQIERLAALWERRLLTDEEFSAAKARLLF